MEMKLLVRDSDVSAMGNDLTKAFSIDMFESEGVRNVHGTSNNNGGSDDKFMVGEDEELIDTATSSGFLLETAFNTNICNVLPQATNSVDDLSLELEKVGISDISSFFQ
ncbi:hypothetical protein SUGI_0729240 [Cryptomeria japonica]|nr:hypothetical protein SUGI_0729240 [Cryptomeria japonica]